MKTKSLCTFRIHLVDQIKPPSGLVLACGLYVWHPWSRYYSGYYWRPSPGWSEGNEVKAKLRCISYIFFFKLLRHFLFNTAQPSVKCQHWQLAQRWITTDKVKLWCERLFVTVPSVRMNNITKSTELCWNDSEGTLL